METRGRLAYLPALDGVRALAVCAVVLFHLEFSLAPGGFLGVSVFFTLSGFLITSLLLAEHAATGGISLRTFYVRRLRRLLPAAWICLALVLAATPVWTGEQRAALSGDALAALGHVANWRAGTSTGSYQELFTSSPSPLAHFWSLAIEEQFYVILPIVAVLSLRRSRRTFATVALVGLAASAVATLATDDFDLAYNATYTRAGELLVGVLLAFVVARWRARDHVVAHWVHTSCGVIGGAGLSALIMTTRLDDAWVTSGGLIAIAVLSAALIVGVHGDTALTRALSSRWLVQIGKVSYGIYLFHWPILLFLTPARVGVDGAALLAIRLGVLVVLTVASSVLVEQPIRERRSLVSAPRTTALTFLSGTTLLLVASTLPLGTRSSTDQLLSIGESGVVLFEASESPVDVVRTGGAAESDLPTGSQAATSPPPDPRQPTVPASPPFRILVVGSDLRGVSAAESFATANAPAGGPHGDETGDDPGAVVEVVDAVQDGCPVVSGTQVLPGEGRVTVRDGCESTYDRVFGALDQDFDTPPDLVIVSVGPIDSSVVHDTRVTAGDSAEDVAALGGRLAAAELEVQALTQLLSEQGAPVALAWWGEPGRFQTALERLDVSRRGIIGVPTTESAVHQVIEQQLATFMNGAIRPPQNQTRVMVLGDSTSLMLARALHDAGRRLDVLWAGDNGCPVVRAVRIHPTLAEGSKQLDCPDFDEKLPSLIGDFEPEIILIVAGPIELAALSVEGGEQPLIPGHDDWIAYHDSEMDALLRVVRDALPADVTFPKVLVADSPPIRAGLFSTPEMARSGRVDAWNAQVERWATGRVEIELLAYADEIVGFEAEYGSIRDDGVHPDIGQLTLIAQDVLVDMVLDALPTRGR